MESKSLEFLKEKFREYYTKNDIALPRDYTKREFGFLLFKENVMIRHRSFRTHEEFMKFIRHAVPSDIYYSSAYYTRPEASMDNKGWIGADLVFDVDADHLPTECKIKHDVLACLKCGFTFSGKGNESCPACGGKAKEKKWFCEKCLDAAKNEVLKLLDFLFDDFGLSSKEVAIFFSGHRGFHVHIESEEVLYLDQAARKEIVDYIRGVGLNLSAIGLGSKVSLDSYSWAGRIARGFYDLLLMDENCLKKLGLTEYDIGLLEEERSALRRIEMGGVRMSRRRFKRILQTVIERQSANIDTIVTTDVRRLIRMPYTLHGKTGLKVMKVPLAQFEAYDPLKEAIVFREKDTVKVRVDFAPKFRFGDEEYGPFSNQVVELPVGAAVLLLCKKAATLAE